MVWPELGQHFVSIDDWRYIGTHCSSLEILVEFCRHRFLILFGIQYHKVNPL